jgi:hypothetical protein
MAQRKETKTTIKVRDLKPKKDAKGGIITRGMPQGNRNSVQSRSLNSSTRSI